ncbi:TIGR01666 family membrane protein, partial [Erwinia amylovora]|uniref:FUSC family membrane protein n=1 Tax=Erwinia amylovora TaxID=552 RepID=UPI0029622082
LAHSGTALLPCCKDQEIWNIPLTIGAVSAAQTDLDDRLSGRLRKLIITLISFCIASVTVELLFPNPWMIIIGLAMSGRGLIIQGD